VARDALKDAITQIFGAIDKEVLLSMFMSWRKRLKWVIQHQVEYYHEE
jgi:hypothetical protein